MQKKKEYTGTVYIGVVGPENENGECRDSIERLMIRSGDTRTSIRATKGYESRQTHINNFIKSQHSFIFLMDHDQIFPADSLERLRRHKMPYVSGFYMRRRYAPMLPVWYEYGPKNQWPMKPMVRIPERGKLHKLGASGWGCILIHRDVFTAVDPLLKGEQAVIEDDMDIWPYDLAKVMQAINGLSALITEQPTKQNLYASLEKHATTLQEEIRPLRVLKSVVGSDIRFPFFAREAGFDLYGDPDVICSHMLNYPLSLFDYAELAGDEDIKGIEKAVMKDLRSEKKVINLLRRELSK